MSNSENDKTVKFVEIAELCHNLNSLTKRQFRPGHQLVKLYNSLIKFSDETYEDADQVTKLFELHNLDCKHSHPFVISKLVEIAGMPIESQKTELANFAKSLDEHEQWEWESRRKAKCRRKTHHNRRNKKFSASTKTLSESNMKRPTSSNTLCSMESHSSEATTGSSRRFSRSPVSDFEHDDILEFLRDNQTFASLQKTPNIPYASAVHSLEQYEADLHNFELDNLEEDEYKLSHGTDDRDFYLYRSRFLSDDYTPEGQFCYEDYFYNQDHCSYLGNYKCDPTLQPSHEREYYPEERHQYSLNERIGAYAESHYYYY